MLMRWYCGWRQRVTDKRALTRHLAKVSTFRSFSSVYVERKKRCTSFFSSFFFFFSRFIFRIRLGYSLGVGYDASCVLNIYNRRIVCWNCTKVRITVTRLNLWLNDGRSRLDIISLKNWRVDNRIKWIDRQNYVLIKYNRTVIAGSKRYQVNTDVCVDM